MWAGISSEVPAQLLFGVETAVRRAYGRRMPPLAPPVTWRPDADTRMHLEQLRATFPKQRWGDVFSWLFADERVREVVRERMNA